MLQPPTPEISEQDLINALRQGRTEALGLLYDKYAPVLMGLATRIMREQEAAETVLQDTFKAVWERKATYDASRLSLLSWLILLTRDTAMAALKAENRNVLRSGQKPLAQATTEKENQREGKVAIEIKEIFCNLAPNEKAALNLMYLQGFTCTEAAAELGIAEETLKSWLKTASQHLREGRGQ
jgi:RNA polymerase sigma factor (sigma-70 family)